MSSLIILTFIIIGQGFIAFLDKPIQDRLGMSRLVWGSLLNFPIAGLFLILFQWYFKTLFPPRMDSVGIALLAFLVIAHSIIIIWYLELVRDESISYVVPATSIYPVITTILGVVFLKETIGFAKGGAIASAVFAVYLLFRNTQKAGRISWRTLRSTLILICLMGVSAFLDKPAVERLGMSRFVWGFFFWNIAAMPIFFVYRAKQILPSGLSSFGSYAKTLAVWSLASPLIPVFRLLKSPLLPPLRWDALGVSGIALKIFVIQLLSAGLWLLLLNHPVSFIVPAFATYPAVTALLAWLLLKEPLPPNKIFAILLAIASVAALSQLH